MSNHISNHIWNHIENYISNHIQNVFGIIWSIIFSIKSEILIQNLKNNSQKLPHIMQAMKEHDRAKLEPQRIRKETAKAKKNEKLKKNARGATTRNPPGKAKGSSLFLRHFISLK